MQASPAWTPPPHDAPALSALIDPIVEVVAFLSIHRFWVMPVAMLAIPVLLGWAASTARRHGRPMKVHGGLIVIFVIFAVFNLTLGPWISTILVYHAGVSGSATVTESHATSAQYNSRTVRAHSVLIRGADGRVIETSFDSDDFNVYPSHNETYFPGKGDVFTARYLKHAPRTFAIVANDDSPWAHGLRCDKLLQAIGDAGEKTGFAPDEARYKSAYDEAVAAARSAGCDL